jgi:hypothetical protein
LVAVSRLWFKSDIYEKNYLQLNGKDGLVVAEQGLHKEIDFHLIVDSFQK